MTIFPDNAPFAPQTKVTGIITGLILTAAITHLIRIGKLKPGYALLWFVLAAIILLFSVFDSVFFGLSKLLGIYYAPAMLFGLLIVNMLIINVHFSLVVTKMEKRITMLAQEVAFLKQSKKTKKKV